MHKNILFLRTITDIEKAVVKKTTDIPFTAKVKKHYEDGTSKTAKIHGVWHQVQSTETTAEVGKSYPLSDEDCD